MSAGRFTYDIPPGVLGWLENLQDGELFDIAFVDRCLEMEMENNIGMEMEQGREYFDIMVSLKNGLDPTAGHLSITTKFTRHPAAEGVAQVNDRINRDLADRLT